MMKVKIRLICGKSLSFKITQYDNTETDLWLRLRDGTWAMIPKQSIAFALFFPKRVTSKRVNPITLEEEIQEYIVEARQIREAKKHA